MVPLCDGRVLQNSQALGATGVLSSVWCCWLYSQMPGMMDAQLCHAAVCQPQSGPCRHCPGQARTSWQQRRAAAAAAAAGNFGRAPDSPKRSNSNVSQLFDALVVAATGGTEGAAAAAAGGEAPVESRLGGGLGPVSAAAAATAGSGALPAFPRRRRRLPWRL